MTPRPRPSALAALALGLGLALVAVETAPLPGPPLYDGVVPVEAYRWPTPPPSQHRGAKSASQVLEVNGGTSPLIAVVTEFGDFVLTQAGPPGTPAASGGVGATGGPSGAPRSAEPTPAASGAAAPGGQSDVPQVTILAAIAIAVVLAGLFASAFLPRRKPRGAARRPPPRTRR